MNNTEIHLTSPIYEVISIEIKTKAQGWKDIKPGDIIMFKFDPCKDIPDNGKFMYVHNKTTDDLFNIRCSQFRYMIDHFKLKEMV